MYTVAMKNTVPHRILKYYSLFSVISIIGMITPMPSNAYTEKPIASGQRVGLIA